MKYVSYIDSFVGIIEIISDGEFLLSVSTEFQKKEENSCDLNKKCEIELKEYFDGKRKKFDLPLFLDGTEFQKKVWNELRYIPYGFVSTYLNIAKKVGSEKSCRAVGGSVHRNPFFILLPCHRVIGTNGTLVGFASGLKIKKDLLDFEQCNL